MAASTPPNARRGSGAPRHIHAGSIIHERNPYAPAAQKDDSIDTLPLVRDAGDPDNYHEDDSDNNDGPEEGSAADDSGPGEGSHEREHRAKLDELAYEGDALAWGVRHGDVKAQRQAFLYFLISASSADSLNSTINHTAMVYFSLMFQLVSPFGLMGNLASLISLCDRWRKPEDGSTLTDAWWVLFMNSLALSCGCIANVVLFLHAERWMHRLWGLIAVCALYLTAVMLYMALLGATQVVYFDHNQLGPIQRTSGYWHAVCAPALYFVSAVMLMANLVYFRGKAWNTSMSNRQRRIMALCTMYLAWIAIGGAMFQPHSMLDVSYADAAYFCIISSLTVGYGDIVPVKTLPRALTIPYMYAGLVLGALATVSIFSASFSSTRTESLATHIELRRKAELDKPIASEEESFEIMRHILRSAEDHALLFRAILTVSWLVIFWLIGALIFMYIEHWTYFEAFYYVAISLATVGYGDFSPKTDAGRSFFLYWGLLAVPTMTTAVSDLTAIFMGRMRALRMLKERLKVLGITKAYQWYKRKRDLRAGNIETLEEVGPNKRLRTLAMHMPNSERWHDVVRLTGLPAKSKFGLETWHAVVCEVLGVSELPLNFWISDLSPIRVPTLDEREFVLLATLNMLRLAMPETEDELAAKDAASDLAQTTGSMQAPNSSNATTASRSSGTLKRP